MNKEHKCTAAQPLKSGVCVACWLRSTFPASRPAPQTTRWSDSLEPCGDGSEAAVEVTDFTDLFDAYDASPRAGAGYSR
jgi:hypothetical protein